MLRFLLGSLYAQIYQAYPQQRSGLQIERTYKLPHPFLCFLADHRVRIRSRIFCLYLCIFHLKRHGVLNPLHWLTVHQCKAGTQGRMTGD
ncbi:hypothetical protein D3C74_267190 [compost metagenome]